MARFIKGSHHTEETKAKLREMNLKGLIGRKGHTNTPLHNARISASNKSAYSDPQRIEVIKERNARIHKSPEFRERMRQQNLGQQLTLEQKERYYASIKTRWQRNPHPWLGRKRTVEQRRQMSINHIGLQAGAKHPRWLGGITLEPYGIGWTAARRNLVRERDFFTCQLCLKGGNSFHVHHIDYNKKNNVMDNLITLCRNCHSKLHAKTKINKTFWIDFFTFYLSLRQIQFLTQGY